MSIVIKKVKQMWPSGHEFFYMLLKGPKRYKHLYKSIKFLKANTLLEIGVWNGDRAKKMIEVAKKYNEGTIRYYGFDLFEDLSKDQYLKEMSKIPPTKEYVQNKLTLEGVEVHLFSGNTLDTLPKEINEMPTMDFVFIDGGHSNETILNDWIYCSKLIGPKSVVIFDDYWRNRTDGGCKLTVDNIDKTIYKVEILPEIDIFENPDFGHLEISFAKVTLK